MKSLDMIILGVFACFIAVVQAGFLPKLTAQDMYTFYNHQAIPIMANSGMDVPGKTARNGLLTVEGCTDKIEIIAKNIDFSSMNLTPKKDFKIATWSVECKNVHRKDPKKVMVTLTYDIIENDKEAVKEKQVREVLVKYHKPYDRSEESVEKSCKKDSKSCKKDSKSCKKDSKSCKKDETNHRPPKKSSHKKTHHEDSKGEDDSFSNEKTSKKKTTPKKGKFSSKKRNHKGKNSSSSGVLASMTLNKFLFLAGAANAILFLI